jgi:predicted metal-dependent peptidase
MLQDLDKVRTVLVNKEPLMAFLFYHKKVVETDDPSVIAYTDGETITIGTEHWNKASLQEKLGIILHELSHCMLEHPWLLKEIIDEQDRIIFNVASDIVINKQLAKYKVAVLDTALHSFADVGAPELDNIPISEKTSLWFMEQLKKKARAVKILSEGCGLGPKHKCIVPASGDNSRQQQRGQIEAALRSGIEAGTIGGELTTALNKLKETETNWKRLLARWLQVKNEDIWRFKKQREWIIRPKLCRFEESKADLIMIIDSSGSIDDDTLCKFACEVYTILRTCGRRVWLLVTDAEVQQEVLVENISQIPTKFKGRGGTQFLEAFKRAKELVKEFDTDPILVILTDGYIGDLHELVKPCDTLWVIVNNKNFKAPFGETVHIRYQ